MLPKSIVNEIPILKYFNGVNKEIAKMIKYEEIVYVSKKEFDRINRLLAIESLEDMTDNELLEQGANTDVCEGLFYVEFDDGSIMNIDLCSGQHNYYDDVVWISADGKTEVILDCAYKLDDIEVEIGSKLYVVKFKIQ